MRLIIPFPLATKGFLPRLSLLAVALIGTGVQTPVFAQAASPSQPSTSAPVFIAQELPVVEIHASPLRDTDAFAQPISIISKRTLQEQGNQASLGAVLAKEPGIQESGFGPGASRPIIRGQEGPRLRVQRNNLGINDLSALSPDHAVAIDTLTAQHIEILQGPATLLYGTQAMGGVINIVDDLLPAQQRKKTEGSVQFHGNTADQSSHGAATLQGGSAPFNWSIEAFGRNSEHVRTPQGRLASSDQRSHGATVNTSWMDSHSKIGLQLNTLDKNYGIAGSTGTRIDLLQHAFQLAGEHDMSGARIERVRWNLGTTRYKHNELEDTGEIGTTFRQRGTEGRMELTHRQGQGAFGVHWNHETMSATGEESLISPTRQNQIGIFTVQEHKFASGTASWGARYDLAKSHNEGSPEGATVVRGVTERQFSLVNISAGWNQPLNNAIAFKANLTAAQRAPDLEALYAEGDHEAVQRYTLGNPNLNRERSFNVDIGFQNAKKSQSPLEWKTGLFYNRFHNYIYATPQLDGTGAPVLSAGGLPVEQFGQQGATFKGAEWSLRYTFPDTHFFVGTWGDVVRATLQDGTPPPRLAPARVALTTGYRHGAWRTEVEALHRFSPKSLARNEADTKASTQLDARLSYTVRLNESQRLQLWLEGSNLTNQTIRLHTSYLKDQAPLAGRSLHAGAKLSF